MRPIHVLVAALAALSLAAAATAAAAPAASLSPPRLAPEKAPPGVWRYRMVVTAGAGAPDCGAARPLILISGLFQPTIEARAGACVRVLIACVVCMCVCVCVCVVHVCARVRASARERASARSGRQQLGARPPAPTHIPSAPTAWAPARARAAPRPHQSPTSPTPNPHPLRPMQVASGDTLEVQVTNSLPPSWVDVSNDQSISIHWRAPPPGVLRGFGGFLEFQGLQGLVRGVGGSRARRGPTVLRAGAPQALGAGLVAPRRPPRRPAPLSRLPAAQARLPHAGPALARRCAPAGVYSSPQRPGSAARRARAAAAAAARAPSNDPASDHATPRTHERTRTHVVAAAAGTAWVSQCPIPRGQSFTYRFRVDEPPG
jgi:hypothetical protein